MAIAGPGDTVKVHVEGDSLWAELPGFQPDDAPELGDCSIRPGWIPSVSGR